MITILDGDALNVLKTFENESIHCAVTSPPYFGLRDYKVEGQVGLEKTPEEYVRKMVEIFHEVKRVLRSDGTFWLNIGDSYASNNMRHNTNDSTCKLNNRSEKLDSTIRPNTYNDIPEGYKAKDMLGIPWMLAFALRADGWYLRADLPWIKRNSMPSSVTDRPSSSIEHVFLLSKSKKYYYDHIATMQPIAENSIKRISQPNLKNQKGGVKDYGKTGINNTMQMRMTLENFADRINGEKKQDNVGNNTYTGFNARYEDAGTGLRFMRDSDFFFRTWQGLLHNEDGEPMALVVNPRGYKGAHFACFPIQLVEPLILTGTSEKGVCEKCGSPWKRIVTKELLNSNENRPDNGMPGRTGLGLTKERAGDPVVTTTGWQTTCTCDAGDPIPALVLDPFSGSGATGVACKWHNRNYLGIELNPEYCKLSEHRIRDGK